jgi:uncharacterized membrane protein YgcG
MAYLFGAFVSFFAGVAAFGFTDNVVAGVFAGAVVFLVAACLVRWRDDAGMLRGDDEEKGRVRNTGASAGIYSQSSHGGEYFDGGGSDGGGGGSC